MKIRKSMLLEALKVLGKVVAQTSPVEVVRSVRFVGDGGRLRLVATDGVECVAVSVECEVAEAVEFAVEYRALRELIRSTRGGRGRGLREAARMAGAGGGSRGGGQSRASGHVRRVARAGGSGCGSRWCAAHSAGRQSFS